MVGAPGQPVMMQPQQVQGLQPMMQQMAMGMQ
jgi:hypothetical protein